MNIDKKINEKDKEIEKLIKDLADVIDEKYNKAKENNNIDYLANSKKSLKSKLEMNKEEMEFNIERKKTNKYMIIIGTIALFFIIGIPTITNIPVNHINVLSISLLVCTTYKMLFDIIEIDSKIRKIMFDKELINLELKIVNKAIEELKKEEE